MKANAFIKVMLVLIAVFLGIIALRPFLEVGAVSANPGGKFDFMQIWGLDFSSPNEARLIIFDSRSGELWLYPSTDPGTPPRKIGKLNELGKPIQK